MNIYNNLKFIREKLGLSQNAFAEKLGFNVSNISRWESSKNGMSLETAMIISEKLNISLPDLVGKDLRIEENILLDDNHKLDYAIMEKSKELSEDDKKKLINVIDTIFDNESKK